MTPSFGGVVYHYRTRTQRHTHMHSHSATHTCIRHCMFGHPQPTTAHHRLQLQLHLENWRLILSCHPSACLSTLLCLPLSLFLSISLCLSPSTSVYLSLSVCLSIHLFVRQSVSKSVKHLCSAAAQIANCLNRTHGAVECRAAAVETSRYPISWVPVYRL